MSRGTLDPARCRLISLTGLSPSSVCFPKTVQLSSYNTVRSPNPDGLGPSVWPLSFSLAATKEIDFSFSSCRYLDVSVHGVSLPQPMYSVTDD